MTALIEEYAMLKVLHYWERKPMPSINDIELWTAYFDEMDAWLDRIEAIKAELRQAGFRISYAGGYDYRLKAIEE